MALHQGDVQRLPFADRLFRGDAWRDAAVEGTHVVCIDRLAETFHDLDFIDAAQIDPAVAALQGADFDGQIEIFEHGVRAQIAEVFVLDDAVLQHAVHHAPTVVGAGIDQAPTAEILAVEEFDGRAELHLREVGRRRHFGDAFAGEFGSGAECRALGVAFAGGELEQLAAAFLMPFVFNASILAFALLTKLLSGYVSITS